MPQVQAGDGSIVLLIIEQALNPQKRQCIITDWDAETLDWSKAAMSWKQKILIQATLELYSRYTTVFRYSYIAYKKQPAPF